MKLLCTYSTFSFMFTKGQTYDVISEDIEVIESRVIKTYNILDNDGYESNVPLKGSFFEFEIVEG